jgi:hypothetical protein
MTDTEEWISITEYASRKRISERQARRVFASLPAELKSKPEERPSTILWCVYSGKPSPGLPAESPAMSDERPADVRHDVQYQALAKTLDILQDQLAKKDAQLDEKDAQIAKLQAAADTEQRFRILEATQSVQKQIAPARNFVQRLLAAWKDQRTDQ